MFELTGKKAIVTGAGSGLGRGMAAGLHMAGAELVIIDINDTARITAEDLGRNGAPVHHVLADLTDRQSLSRAFEESVRLLGGRLDVLVNNAGMHDRRSYLDLPVEDWDMVIELNITAVFHLCKLAGALMIPQGSGKIINMASMQFHWRFQCHCLCGKQRRRGPTHEVSIQ